MEEEGASYLKLKTRKNVVPFITGKKKIWKPFKLLVGKIKAAIILEI